MAVRFRDHNAQVGNLEPGQTLFAERIVDTIPMTPYSWDELIALHRARNTFRDAAPAYSSAPYRQRSVRRCS